MKKKIIYSSVLTALLSASSIALAGGPEVMPEPDYFSGFYVGGIGGVHHNTFNGSSSVNLTQPVNILLPFIPPLTLVQAGTLNNTNVSGGDFSGYGGVQGGFGKAFNHMFYVGVQGWGEWGSTSTTETQYAAIPFNNPTIAPPTQSTSFRCGEDTCLATRTFVANAAASASTSTTMKISNDYGVAAKLGWIVAPRSMLYGKVGASWANIETSNSLNVNASSGTSVRRTLTNTTTSTPIYDFTVSTANSVGLSANSNQTDTKPGLLLGLGFEQFVYLDIVSLNVEYDYVNYGNVSTGPATLSGTSTASASCVNNLTGTACNGFPSGTTGPRPVNTNVTSQATSDAKSSSLMAGINFYFGRDWI